jgi:neurofibromin 1
MCRAAIHIRPAGEVPLRLVASDIAHEFKVVNFLIFVNCALAEADLDLQSTLWSTHTQKPFWDSVDEIDVAMYSGALVTVFRFLSEDESIPLFLACIEPERSEAVKVCAVKACSTLVTEVSLALQSFYFKS